ncbi:hypothetical protein PR003_g2909 [Phytophthora rubi]|uniref:Reverse transcriptase Ty1/copia-type domain-containing protein n=1 Tax=Phytophthora rubi TaxID=129364 RepID=A0A6A3P2I4_9STRA|nr:hypothetical protein PR002_g1397 [Phytophthora rubi]KAE9355294.1 hypothetical protein PR003_g2909 [Phytophthora rubi]
MNLLHMKAVRREYATTIMKAQSERKKIRVVDKASQCTHNPTMPGWTRYLAGSKILRLTMKDQGALKEPLKVIAYSDADFAADKADRKSVAEGLLTVDGMPVSGKNFKTCIVDGYILFS